MIRINSITIKEFRGVRDLTLEFQGKNFAICGPNGTGKSGIVEDRGSQCGFTKVSFLERRRFQKEGIEYEWWSSATIRTKLAPHPTIVRTFCGPPWIEQLCGSQLPSSTTPSHGRAVVVDALERTVDELASRVSENSKNPSAGSRQLALRRATLDA